VLVLCGPGGTLGTEPGRVMRQGQRRRLTAAPSGAMAIAGCVAGSSMTPRCFYVTRSPRRRGDRPGPTVVDDQVAAYRALDDLGRIHPVAQRVHGAVAVCGGGWHITEQQSERPDRHAHLLTHAIPTSATWSSRTRRRRPGGQDWGCPAVHPAAPPGPRSRGRRGTPRRLAERLPRHPPRLPRNWRGQDHRDHYGRAAIVMVQQMLVTQEQAPNPGLPRPGMPALLASATPPPLNREQRRKQARQARRNP
jgi:hypothetical protein